MANVEIELIISTDGDFHLKNEDTFFKEAFEEYSKTIIVDEKDINTNLSDLFQVISDRVYNRCDQKNYLIEKIKQITPYKDFTSIFHKTKNKIDPQKQYKINKYVNIEYLGGNQSIELNIKKTPELKDYTLFELIKIAQTDYDLRLGQIMENIRIIKGDLFNISDENLRLEIIKLIEKGSKNVS